MKYVVWITSRDDRPQMHELNQFCERIGGERRLTSATSATSHEAARGAR
jgi:hypothetical protein